MAPLSSTAWGEKITVLCPVGSPVFLHSPECSSLAVGAGSSVLAQAVVPGATSPGSCILADGWRSGLSVQIPGNSSSSLRPGRLFCSALQEMPLE